MKLDFLVIGFPRCGTTWLYGVLKKHPDIFLPEEKELAFFNKEYEKGFDYYRKWFAEAGSEQICGEMTPNYIYSEPAMQRIYQSFPEVKLIIVMRDPIHRLYSSYRFFYEEYNGQSFQGLVNDSSFLRSSQYINFIKEWSECFSYESFKFIIFEDLISRPKDVLTEIMRFLNVNPDVDLEIKRDSENISIFPKLQSTLYRYKLSWVIDMTKKTFLDSMIRNLAVRKSHRLYNSIDRSTYNRLLGYYRKYNEELSNFIKKDVSIWYRSDT